MAPGALVEDQPQGTVLTRRTTDPVPENEAVPRSLFPDGIRTSGQHAPLYDALRPFSEFPKEITGPTVWKAEDYKDRPDRWVHPFTDEEIGELGDAADRFIASGIPLTGISKVSTLPMFP